jgi:hypothetical protein
LKSAATDLDGLKCEQLHNQCKLIQVKEELFAEKSVQFEAVKENVDQMGISR